MTLGTCAARTKKAFEGSGSQGIHSCNTGPVYERHGPQWSSLAWRTAGSPQPGKPWGNRETQTPGGHQATPAAGVDAPRGHVHASVSLLCFTGRARPVSWLALSGLWLCGIEPRARLSGSGGGVSGCGAGDIRGGGTWPGASSARPGAESASGSGSGSGSCSCSGVLSDRGRA